MARTTQGRGTRNRDLHGVSDDQRELMRWSAAYRLELEAGRKPGSDAWMRFAEAQITMLDYRASVLEREREERS